MVNRPNPKIGCFIYNWSTFWSMLAHGVSSGASEYGASVEVLSARDVEGQDQVLAQFIQQGVDALVVGAIDPIHAARSAAAAARVGIPVIAVVAELPGTAARANVRIDDIGGAQHAAEHLAGVIGGRGIVANLQGALDIPTAVNRSEGFRAGIARHPEIQIVFQAECRDWSYALGQRRMREALAAHPDICGVFAAGDAIALGALDAIDAAGKIGQIAVVGFDGQPDGLAAIYSGRLSATVDQPSHTIGWTAADAVRRLLRGEEIPPVITIPSKLITSANLLSAAMETVRLMPGLFQSLLESGEAQRRLQDEIILAQQTLIQELSAPILPLADGIMALPLVGAIDSLRANRITELLLETISRTRTQSVIIDISGVPVVDTGVANHLIKTAAAARLLGTSVILVGISPELAQTMVQLGIDLSGILTFSTIREGLIFAQAAGARERALVTRR